MGSIIAYAAFVTIAYVAAVLKGHFEDIKFEEEIQQMYLEDRKSRSAPIRKNLMNDFVMLAAPRFPSEMALSDLLVVEF